MNNITFRGGGYNAASIREANRNANDSSSRKTIPAGATWPFVRLDLTDSTAEFSLLHIHKVVTPATVESVCLSKMGYFAFRTYDHTNEFGFTTLKISMLLNELQKRGYKFDPSLQRNLPIAKVFLAVTTTISLAVVAIVTSLAISEAQRHLA